MQISEIFKDANLISILRFFISHANRLFLQIKAYQPSFYRFQNRGKNQNCKIFIVFKFKNSTKNILFRSYFKFDFKTRAYQKYKQWCNRPHLMPHPSIFSYFSAQIYVPIKTFYRLRTGVLNRFRHKMSYN